MSRGPEQAPQHISFVDTTERRSGFLPPADVAQAALAEIQSDGSVFWGYDEDDDQRAPVFFPPEEPIVLDELGPGSYSSRLFGVARAINGAVVHIERDGAGVDAAAMVQQDIRLLARYLGPYRHDPAFIQFAASLSTIDEHGALCGPTLPPGDPREWVPRVRAALAYQNAAPKSAP